MTSAQLSAAFFLQMFVILAICRLVGMHSTFEGYCRERRQKAVETEPEDKALRLVAQS